MRLNADVTLVPGDSLDLTTTVGDPILVVARYAMENDLPFRHDQINMPVYITAIHFHERSDGPLKATIKAVAR